MARPPPILRGHTNYKRNRQAIPWGVPLTLLTKAYQQTLYQCSERVGISSVAVCVRQRAELGGLLVWICTVKGVELFSHLPLLQLSQPSIFSHYRAAASSPSPREEQTLGLEGAGYV